MRRLIAASALFTLPALVLLAGCSGEEDEPAAGAPPASAADQVLADYDLDGLPGDEVVDRLDRMPVSERPGDLMASVRDDQLLLNEGGDDEATVDLPDDKFYLSVAPYVDQTHDCYFHSLTTCKGELGGEEVTVTITDDAGEVLVEETTEVFDNGFVGFWLPDDVTGTVEVTYEGRTGEVPFATGDEDPTCLTTLQLA
ncbi:CueP family metal-binding protein [Nocardioides ferulae]|uniref:CueP family metal-binding protein n=1 Tax=Nocardioides ferulae TaxID=2340821 RepID=UPI000EAFB62C|nr:CueP family metal-binding protein [Nocardioides ferulae]